MTLTFAVNTVQLLITTCALSLALYASNNALYAYSDKHWLSQVMAITTAFLSLITSFSGSFTIIHILGLIP